MDGLVLCVVLLVFESSHGLYFPNISGTRYNSAGHRRYGVVVDVLDPPLLDMLEINNMPRSVGRPTNNKNLFCLVEYLLRGTASFFIEGGTSTGVL